MSATPTRKQKQQEEAVRGRAREALNLALDRLGNPPPDARQTVALMALADRAFAPGTAALKLAHVLFRLAATSKGESR